MKLIHCIKCGDIVRLTHEPLECLCHKSSGCYREDGLHAVVFGPCRVLGIPNNEWTVSLLHPPTRPYQQNYTWFVIGDWPDNHVERVKRRSQVGP